MTGRDCRRCGTACVVFETGKYARLVPETPQVVTLCPQCLALEPVVDPDRDYNATADRTAPAFERVSERFPSGQAAVPFALLVGLLEHLAVYREEITELLEAVERAGIDPLSALEQLTHDPTVEPAADLDRRRQQLQQLL